MRWKESPCAQALKGEADTFWRQAPNIKSREALQFLDASFNFL
jgi:hypothetical protein